MEKLNTLKNNSTNVHNNGKEEGEAGKKCGFKIRSSKDVQNGIYEQKDFIIDGLITPGLNILGGPKSMASQSLH